MEHCLTHTQDNLAGTELFRVSFTRDVSSSHFPLLAGWLPLTLMDPIYQGKKSKKIVGGGGGGGGRRIEWAELKKGEREGLCQGPYGQTPPEEVNGKVILVRRHQSPFSCLTGTSHPPTLEFQAGRLHLSIIQT